MNYFTHFFCLYCTIFCIFQHLFPLSQRNRVKVRCRFRSINICSVCMYLYVQLKLKQTAVFILTEEFTGIKVLATVTVAVAMVLAALAVFLCLNWSRQNCKGDYKIYHTAQILCKKTLNLICELLC